MCMFQGVFNTLMQFNSMCAITKKMHFIQDQITKYWKMEYDSPISINLCHHRMSSPYLLKDCLTSFIF